MSPQRQGAATTDHWHAIVGSPATPEALARSADQLCVHFRAGLGRWIGIEGYQAIHDRALAVVRQKHPELRGHAFEGGDYLATMQAIDSHGTDAIEQGLRAWIVVVIDLLGRVVGRRMATRLAEQSITPSPRGAADSENEGRDDAEKD